MRKEFLYLSVASYNQLQKYLRHCTVFWVTWPVRDLVLVGGGGGDGGGQYFISQTCD